MNKLAAKVGGLENYDWVMAGTYLDAIEAVHRERAARDQRDWRERRRRVAYDGPRLEDALRRRGRVTVIAEVKRRSPSKGWLGQHLDPAALASAYVAGGAAAVSVLTDEPHFAGSRADLEAVRAAVAVPLLRKDFTVCENDVLDTAEMGASGVLLIAALLSDDELSRFTSLALDIGLSPLVEVHDAREAEAALAHGARIVGVNQRDLRTFEVNPEHAARVISVIPPDVLRVAESGLRSPDDVAAAGRAGFDAVLVGESFVTAESPERAVRSFARIGGSDV